MRNFFLKKKLFDHADLGVFVLKKGGNAVHFEAILIMHLWGFLF